MAKKRNRPCNTVIVSDLPEHVNFRDLDIGNSFIRTEPTQPDNPCVYYKKSQNEAITQAGTYKPLRFSPSDPVVRVKVVETHIVILDN